VEATVDHLLRRAARAERRRVVAWLLAGVPVAAAAAALGSGSTAAVLAVIAAALSLWSVRQVTGIAIARRDFEAASTPPRRAFVVLLHDPNPRAVRPLLAVWDERPSPGERLPKPRSVWRCDDELLELESTVGDVEVHEVWLDTGGRSCQRAVRFRNGISAFRNALRRGAAELGSLWAYVALRSTSFSRRRGMPDWSASVRAASSTRVPPSEAAKA
jgi:hypothetical protein